MILRTIGSASRVYGINIDTYYKISSKSAKIKCHGGNCFFVKETELYTDEKYDLLANQGVPNILYPRKNKDNRYVNNEKNNLYIVSDYIKQINISNEYRAKYLFEELVSLHLTTRYKKVLSTSQSRKKMEELYEYLQYKFNTLESFIRSVECQPFDENSIVVLKNYQYILDCKKIMAKYNKKLVFDIKNSKSVYYSFVHNNPKIYHILMSNEGNYLISLEKSKMGIPILDIVKFYLFNENLNIDIKQIITNYLDSYEDEFYYNYFYFFVMVYYIKGIIVLDKEYVTSQSFVFAANKLKKFKDLFELTF